MIDPNKRYKTRDGRDVRIYATDGAPPTPIHGSILWHMFSDVGKKRGQWRMYAWKSNGRDTNVDGWCVGCTDPGPHSWLDLIEVDSAMEIENAI